MAVSAAHKMTADEFFALPDELPHPQLIDGALVVNSPAARHQRIILRLAYEFMRHAETHPGSGEAGIEIDTPIDERNVFKPDLWWVPEERRLADDVNRFPEVPSLVAEVRSPSTWRYDIGAKFRHYEAAGVLELWLVDSVEDTVLVHRRSAPDVTNFDIRIELHVGDELTSPLVDGLAIDLRTLFAR